MSDPKVTCVVLTWNGRDVLMECLEALKAVSYPCLDVVVSDNGSTDGSIEDVRSRFPSVTVLENGRNLRWSGGNNVGIEHAMAHGADYVLLLNNDTVVAPEFVGELVRAGEADETIGVLGPKIYYHDRPRVIWYAGGVVSLVTGIVKHRGIREEDHGQYDEPADVDYVTGCALMIKRAVVETIGLIDPSYLAYAEDTDYSLRAHQAGFRARYVPTSVVWHKVGASWGIVTPRKIRQKLRSHCILMRRHAPVWALFTTVPLFLMLDAFRVLGLVLSGRLRRRASVSRSTGSGRR